jgi:hypothetical protein
VRCPPLKISQLFSKIIACLRAARPENRTWEAPGKVFAPTVQAIVIASLTSQHDCLNIGIPKVTMITGIFFKKRWITIDNLIDI